MSEWITRGICYGMDPNVFFQGNPNKAKAVCGNCPVKAECAEYAIARPTLEGVWGGMTDNERASYRRRRRKVNAAARGS